MILQVKALSLEMAKLMVDSAENMAIQNNIKIAITILDNHGNLKYFRRMDHNSSISIRMSQVKASTSASMPVSTKELALRNEKLLNLPYLAVEGIVLLEGGIPIITKDGQHIGAIGISGATPELDGLCAEEALKSIEQYL